MKASEYFGDWMDVIDTVELRRILSWVSTIDKTTLCPSSPNIFKAFRACPLKDCKVVFLGQDPYPQQGVATGILFGNSEDTPEHRLSPSLQVVKEAAINYEIPHNRIDFDNTLESWAKQGILMINTAFTCEVGRVGSHFDIWKPFTAKLIHNLNTKDGGIIYVLFAEQLAEVKNVFRTSYDQAIALNSAIAEDIKVKQNEIASIQTQIEFNQQVADDNSKYISKLKDLIS